MDIRCPPNTLQIFSEWFMIHNSLCHLGCDFPLGVVSHIIFYIHRFNNEGRRQISNPLNFSVW